MPTKKPFKRLLGLMQFGKKKSGEIVASGGFEILKRIIGQDYSNNDLLSQYSKSLYVFACVSKIAEKISSLELNLFKVKNSRGDTNEIDSHMALDLLYKPNNFQSKDEFWKIMQINLKTVGQAFWLKIRNNQGNVVELMNLRPDLMEVVPGTDDFIKEYKFLRADGVRVPFEPSEIIHFKYPNPLNERIGLAPLVAGQTRVQTENFATQHQRDFFLNNGRPDAVLKTAKNSMDRKDVANIREQWEERHGGVGNNSKIAVLYGGMEYQQISLTQKEMDFIESVKFTRDDILTLFKVPKPIVAITDDVNRANAETAMYIFLSETIVPEMRNIVEKLNVELIYPDFGEEFYLDFDDPTPKNRETLIAEYEKGIQNNWLLINEVRAWENLPPVKGGWSFYMPLIQQAVGGLPQNEKGLKDLIAKIEAIKNADDRTVVEKKERIYSFKGRFLFRQKLLIKEKMAEITAKKIKELEKKNKKKKKGVKKISKKKGTSYFSESPEMRKDYADMIVKKIDTKSNKLKSATDKFFDNQKERVLNNLDEQKSLHTKFAGKDIFDMSKEVGLAAEFMLPFVEEYLKEAGTESLNLLAPAEDFTTTSAIQKFIKKRAKDFSESVNSTTLDKLDATLAEGIAAGEGNVELRNRVEEVYSGFPTYRSELIARTEATAANNEGTLQGYKQSNVATGKEWIAVMDDRTRDEHAALDGEIVGLDKAFSNGLQLPSEPNCRCVLGAAFVEE